MSVSVRGQMFCECGMELRTSFSPKDTISNRLCELIYRWNRRRIGQSKANINGKVFDPCPFCGSNKLTLNPGAPAISCKCGMRFKLEQKDIRVPTVDELLLEWNRKISETEGVEA